MPIAPRTKALITLFAIAPVLTEIVSGNTPVRMLAHPQVAAFLIVAYGLPLLIIRETAVRWRIPTAGIFLFGLAYGIVNEGLLAQTLIRYQGVPIRHFDHYLCRAGFNFSWIVLIVPWHAFFAVIFPLALLRRWFPALAETNWLGRRSFTILAGITGGLLIFLGLVRKPHAQMIACLAAIAVLALLAFLFRGRDSQNSILQEHSARSFFWGMFYYPLYFLGLIVLAARHVPGAAYLAATAFVFLVIAIHARRSSLLRAGASFGLGAYFAASAFHLHAAVVQHSASEIAAGVLLCIAFPWLAFVRKRDPLANRPPLAAG